MKDIALRDILVLAICVALVAGGAYFFVNRQSSNQESVALEPIRAVPMRVPNASDSAPQPPARSRTPDRLGPRAVTPPTSTSSTVTSSSTSSSTASSSDASTQQQDTATSDTTLPEPSERPSDAATPSDATLPSTSSEPASSTATDIIIAAATPSALPVRNSAQGWAVQAGAFKNALNATTLRDRLLKLGLAARVETGADGVNRVLVGAYSSAEAARAASVTAAAALK